LTKDAGLTRRDIHGVDRRGRHVERRHDIAAAVRRTLGRVGRRRSAAAVGTTTAAAGVTGALAGFTKAGAFVVAVAVAVAVAIDRHAPDVVFDADVAPKAIVTHEHEDGLTDAEYARRLAIHSERNELKEEKIEARRKKQRAKAKGDKRTF
jgi:hypothetical protein